MAFCACDQPRDDRLARRDRRGAPCRRRRAGRVLSRAAARGAPRRGGSGRRACRSAARRAKPTISTSGSRRAPVRSRDLVEQLALERRVRRPTAPRRRCARLADARRPARCGTCTPFVIAMIGAAPSTCSHIARAVSPCSSETAFARRARRRPATVMLNGSPPISPHLGVDQLAAGAQAAQLGERVHLVARGDRRVGGEHDALAHLRATPPRNGPPRSMRSAIISMPANTAWPSLKW